MRGTRIAVTAHSVIDSFVKIKPAGGLGDVLIGSDTGPLVSIVIPVYNQKHQFLEECIESAINQTYPNIEIVISDNHCTNGTSEIIAKYAQINKKIRIIKPVQFLPMMEHFSYAYSNVLGEYICPLSSDDVLFPAFVDNHLFPFFKYPTLSFTYSLTAFYRNNFNGKPIFLVRKREERVYKSRDAIRNFIDFKEGSFGGILIKKDNFISAGGFPRNIRFAGDVWVMLALIKTGDVYFIAKTLSGVRVWERDEMVNRMEVQARDINTLYADVVNDALLMTLLDDDKNMVSFFKDRRLKQFCYRMPYRIYRFKDKKQMLECASEYLQGIFMNDVFVQFILRNRTNIIGLMLSVIYLVCQKLKRVVGKSSG